MYHTGARNNASRYEIARHILTELGQEARLPELLISSEAPDARDVRLNTNKLAAAGGATFTESRAALSQCLK
ncbi:sugar nucleotide-binding protein [Citrobacter telavivensis]|uniref:Sugar nucleotide-binding protein n=1 Tax=Citrobacter telavivensis TaxID=2653932 RepID=A0A6L5EAD4_9ENTR|nr:sugar nucleotide-binding protein [Citrobacter telavivensis]QFS73907.1 sugar nucleotide-binding protein [Citrobacter telavivensis]